MLRGETPVTERSVGELAVAFDRAGGDLSALIHTEPMKQIDERLADDAGTARETGEAEEAVVPGEIYAMAAAEQREESNEAPAEGFTNTPEEEYTEKAEAVADERMERAIELIRAGAQPSVIYGETGLFAMANGDLIDPETAQILWRAKDESTGEYHENAAEIQEKRKPEAGELGNDGRGVYSCDGGKAGTSHSRQGWETLGEQGQQKAQRLILGHLQNNPSDLTEALLYEYGDKTEDLAIEIYQFYTQLCF